MNAIAGIISPTGKPLLAEPPRRMFERMCHDSTQTWGEMRYDRLGLHFGWVGSHSSSTPPQATWSHTHQVAVVLTGEEYHHRNPSAIADDYERHGIGILDRLDGWFSGLILDLRDDTATLFNDRHGMERVYVHETPHACLFASEAKALLAVQPGLRRIDPRGLAEVFSTGCVLQDRTLFTDIRLLPAASAWTFHRDGRVVKRRYFDPAVWEQQPELSPTAYAERLQECFARAVRAHVAPGRPVAMSLTGGLDSRAVMAWCPAEPGALPCYTFGGPYRDCMDVRIARRLADLCRHPHTTLRVGDDFFGRFTEMAEQSVYLSDGTMDVSGAVELEVNRQARAIAPVRLTGNYGSEILRSHVALRPRRLDRTLFTPEFNQLLDEAEETYRAEAACHRLTFIAFKQVPWHHHARYSLERSQLTPRSPFLNRELVALAYQAPPALRTAALPLLELVARGNPRLAGIGTDRALRHQGLPLVNGVLRWWREFTAKAEYVYDYGMPGWLARIDRRLQYLRLERAFLGRHKFYHFRVWYRDRLRDAVSALALAGDAPALCYRPGATQRIVDEHLSGQANWTLELHHLLRLQIVERLLLRQS